VERGREALDTVLGLLVDHHHVVAEVAAVAAVLGRHRDAEQARRTGLAPELAFDLAVLAPLVDALFGGVLLVELADRVGEDGDLLVFHEGRLGHVDDGHCSVLSLNSRNRSP